MAKDKRYQGCVSSTSLDLTKERRAVVEPPLGVDAFPAGMELFPATEDDSWTLIESVIKDSDYYLLIVGGKYGSIDPDLDVSFTEREYDAAVRMGKPVMAFLHGRPDQLTVELSETDAKRRKKLKAFREKVKRSKHVKYWVSADDLAGKVARTWVQFVKRYPAVGWIRADQASSREQLAALAQAQRELEKLQAELERVRTQAPAGAETLAQGEQTFELPTYCHGQWWVPGRRARNEAGRWIDLEVPWDRVFGFMGLRMMQEATSEQLENDLEQLLQIDFVTTVRKAFYEEVKQLAEAAEIDSPKRRFAGVSIADEDFQTILLQFVALGLVQRSSRNRSVKDTSNYWSLTPFGHTRLVQLRALQAGERSLVRDDEKSTPPLEADPEEFAGAETPA